MLSIFSCTRLPSFCLWKNVQILCPFLIFYLIFIYFNTFFKFIYLFWESMSLSWWVVAGICEHENLTGKTAAGLQGLCRLLDSSVAKSCWGPLWSSLLESVTWLAVVKAGDGVCSICKGCWGPRKWRFLWCSAEQATGNHSCSHRVADTRSPCPCSLFLAISRCLRFAGLWAGCNWSGFFVQCSQRLGKLVAHPSFLLPVRGILLSPLGTEQCQPGAMGWCRQNETSSYPFCMVILRSFALLCCWSS